MARKIYGLIGNPLGHSYSAQFFNDFFKSNDIDAEYRNFELEDIGELIELIAEYPDLAGLNVTIPFKQQIIPYLNSLSPLAERVGAVNVVKIEYPSDDDNDFILKGFNTDVAGFVGSVRPFVGDLPETRPLALVFGTGGAAKAICEGAHELGFTPRKVSRSPRGEIVGYDDVNAQLLTRVGLLANATPVGMWPDVDSCLPIPYNDILPGTICFDAVYNPEKTLFLQRCAGAGGVDVGGMQMLKLQAMEAWRIWNDTTN